MMRVYRKGASPNGVNDAATLRDSINLLKNAVYARAAERSGDLLPTSDSNLPQANCSEIDRKCANPNGVNDAATLRDSINLLKNAVYARAAERSGDLLPTSDTKFLL